MRHLKNVFALFLLLMAWNVQAQEGEEEESAGLTPEEVGQYKQQSESLVRYFEYILNSLGSEDYTTKEKDIIITQSFAKAFASDKVQIEDDLDDTREVVTNKDIQAYLKDVDFFFKNVSFEFNIEEISHEVTNDGQIYFLVSLSRHMEGETVQGKKMNNNQTRYLEVNLHQAKKELKIASIYTTKLSEEEELAAWWNSLSPAWKGFFAADIEIRDDITMENVIAVSDTIKVYDQVLWGDGDTLALNTPLLFQHLRNIVNKEALNISNNTEITDLKALNKMTSLKDLNISNTKVSSLTPLRNHTKLEFFHASNTQIADLSPLKYAIELKEVYINNTKVSKLHPLQNFSKLEKLHCYETGISNLSPLAELVSLRSLRCFKTKITDLSALAGLSNLSFLKCSDNAIADISKIAKLPALERLDIENTQVADVSSLKNSKNLRILLANGTKIKNIEPLGSLAQLETIYCDNTAIKQKQANAFMRKNPKTLVVYESEALQSWWTAMDAEWKRYFKKIVGAAAQPSKVELQKMANQTEVNVSGNPLIKTLEPMKMLINLHTLNASNTTASEVSPLADLVDLKTLNLRGTKITNLTPLAKLQSLEMLNIEATSIQDLTVLDDVPSLKMVYADGTGIKSAAAKAFRAKHPFALLTYRTNILINWWKRLPAPWKEVFGTAVKVDKNPKKEQLHSVAGLEKLKVADNSAIRDLTPLMMLDGLKELEMSNTQVNNLTPLARMESIEVLKMPRNPISDLNPIKNLPRLRHLEIESTSVSDFEPIEKMKQLEILNCSGTDLKNLKYMESLSKLKEFSFFSTDVRSLKPIDELKNLTLVKCYQTNLNNKKVNAFRAEHKKCEVVYY